MPKLIQHDGLGRGEHVFLVQRHPVQGFQRRAREVPALFWEGRLRLLEDTGAWGATTSNNGRVPNAKTYGQANPAY